MYVSQSCFFLTILTFVSFPDRDMFMRYLGGGVGHCSPASIPIYEECDDDDMDMEALPPRHGGTTNDGPLEDDEDEVWESDFGEDNDNDEVEDEDGSDTDRPYGSDRDEDEDLGPEDGEDEADEEADLDEYDDL
jgi:hypothetical protein